MDYNPQNKINIELKKKDFSTKHLLYNEFERMVFLFAICLDWFFFFQEVILSFWMVLHFASSINSGMPHATVIIFQSKPQSPTLKMTNVCVKLN